MHVTDFFFYNGSPIDTEYQTLKKKKESSFASLHFGEHLRTSAFFNMNIISSLSPRTFRTASHRNNSLFANWCREYRNRRLKIHQSFSSRGLSSFTRLMAHLKSSATPSFSFVGRSVSLTEQGSVRTKVRWDILSVPAIELSTGIDVGKILLCFGFIMRFRADRGWSLNRSWGAWYSLHPCDYFCTTGDYLLKIEYFSLINS